MDSSTHAVRREYWKDIINQCIARPQGVSAKQWMKDHHVSEKSYYYWLRKFRKETFERASCNGTISVTNLPSSEVSFAELPGATYSSKPFRMEDAGNSFDKPDAAIVAGRIRVELYNSVSEELIRKILAGVTHA